MIRKKSTFPFPRGKSKTEELCRQIFQKLLNKPFLSIRPDFLKNTKTNRKLELDGYNPELGLAFEFNGPTHYKYIPIVHRTKRAFIAQQQRDKLKKQLCEQHGVHLIVIPHQIHPSQLEAFIKHHVSSFLEQKERSDNHNKNNLHPK